MLQAEHQQPWRRQNLVDRMDLRGHELVPLVRAAAPSTKTNTNPVPKADISQ
jgi:hypothetical protein